MRRFLCLMVVGCFLLAPTSASAQTSSANPGSKQTTLATTKPGGYWTGFWTWDNKNWRWYWTWVWMYTGLEPFMPQ